MRNIDDIKKFLIENKYGGRRLKPLMDDKEVDFVANIIHKILNSNRSTLFSYDFHSFDDHEHPFVDQAYFRPIKDYLIKSGEYLEVYHIPCPYCKKLFVSDKKQCENIDLSNVTQCANCAKEYDLHKTEPGVMGIQTSYLDFLEEITKLVKA